MTTVCSDDSYNLGANCVHWGAHMSSYVIAAPCARVLCASRVLGDCHNDWQCFLTNFYRSVLLLTMNCTQFSSSRLV